MKKAILFLVITSLSLYAQSIISGNVTDESGNPLIGANVIVEGTVVGAATDIDGTFSINYVPEGEYTLLVSYFGYKDQLLTTSDTQNLNFVLQQDVFDMDKVVVTGIASERSIGNTEVSVSRVDASELSETNSFSDMGQLLYGKVAGVDIRKASGNVGGGWRFDVRAGGGLNGSEQPVIYVDGIRIDNAEYNTSFTGGQGFSTLADLNPEDIESIEVLKGPAGATSYGTNGSNGVVIITTKKGRGLDRKDGRSFSMKYKRIQGTNEPSYEFSTEKDGYYTADDINAVLTPGDISQQYFSILGGSPSLNYYISFDDRYEEGITVEKDNNYMDRKTARLNLDIVAAKDLTISVSSNYSHNTLTAPMNDNNIFGWMANTIYSPRRPVLDADGNNTYDADSNMVLDNQPYYFTDSASIAGVKYSALSKRFLGSIGLNYRPFSDSKLLSGLKITGRIGIDDSHIREDNTYRPDLFYSVIPAGSRYSSVRQNQELSYEMGMSFGYKIGSLNTNTSLTTQAFDRRYSILGLEKQNFITPAISNIGAGEELTYGDEDFFHARDGGTVITEEISFMDQYFLTLSNRSDFGSMIGSKAAEVNYIGYRFGWRADQTLSAFMPSFITMLKPRYAYGESGVLPGLRDNIELLWSAEPGGAGVGGVLSEIGNPTIEPERISETEIGFDTEMALPMNLGALSVEFTSYNQEATNSLVGKQNSPSTGLTESEEPVNVGKMEMDGTELLLKYSTDIGAVIGFPNFLSTDISYAISKNNNKVISLDDGNFEAQPIYDRFDMQVIQPGLPKYAFYNFKVIGASFDSETGLYTGAQLDTVTNAMWQTDSVYLKRYAFATGVGDPFKQYLGRSAPNEIRHLSLNLRIMKNLKVYALWDWKEGVMMQNDTKGFGSYFGAYKPIIETGDRLGLGGSEPESGVDVLVNFDGDGNISGIKAGKESEYEDVATAYARMDAAYSHNWLRDASFSKLRELSFSYSVGSLDRLGITQISDVQIYYSIQNVWTKTDYDGPDPEISWNGALSGERSVDFLTLQNPRTYTFGITVTF